MPRLTALNERRPSVTPKKAAEKFETARQQWLNDHRDKREFQTMTLDWFVEHWPMSSFEPGFYKYIDWPDTAPPRYFRDEPITEWPEGWYRVEVTRVDG